MIKGEVTSRSLCRFGRTPKVTIMRKFGVAIFPDERAAFNARRVLQELSEQVNAIDASVTVFKNADGSISVLDRSGTKSHLAATGAMIGGLSGLPAGPLAVAMGAVGGALIGTLCGTDESRSKGSISDQRFRCVGARQSCDHR